MSPKWADACVRSGECIKACDYGVNPRFMLAMARVAMAKSQARTARAARAGVTGFREVSSRCDHTVAIAARRRGAGAARPEARMGRSPAEAPDFVFYTGCNVLKTPHIALLALDIMDALGVTYQVMGGPIHCCGIHAVKYRRRRNVRPYRLEPIEKLSHSKSGQVMSWCPNCYVQFTETTFRPSNVARIEAIRDDAVLAVSPRASRDVDPAVEQEVKMRVALHRHPGVPGVMEAAVEILQAVPGVELVDFQQPAVGLQSDQCRGSPRVQARAAAERTRSGRDAGVDALVAVYHSDHRELCAHERDWPFRIINVLEVVGESMGLHRHDRYKELKLMQDAEQIAAECHDLIAQHSLDPVVARSVIAKGLLGDQPLPLK